MMLLFFYIQDTNTAHLSMLTSLSKSSQYSLVYTGIQSILTGLYRTSVNTHWFTQEFNQYSLVYTGTQSILTGVYRNSVDTH